MRANPKCVSERVLAFIPEQPLRRIDLLLVFLATLVLTLLSLQFSFAHARLSIPPAYDDVTYFGDAIQRAKLFHQEGVVAVMEHYVSNPPHAPLSAVLAAAGFLLFGPHEWAPYLMNALLLCSFLLFAVRLTTDLRLVDRILVVLFVCTIPLSAKAVIEFRPDFGAAMFTAMGTVCTLGWAAQAGDRSRLLACGAMFGAALVAKPSIFPFTLFMWGCSLAAAFACQMATAGTLRLPSKALRNILVVGAAGAAVSLPHFIIAHKQIIAYVRFVIYSDHSSSWHLPGGWPAQLAYFVFGESGKEFLGNSSHVLFFLCILGACTILVLVRASGSFRIHWLALMGLLGLAYAFPTANAVKAPFFGMTFQALFVFCLVLSLRYVAHDVLPARFPAVTRSLVLVLTFVISGCLMLPLYPFNGTRGNPATEGEWNLTAINNKILDLVKAHPLPLVQNPKVFLTTTGAVNSTLLIWIASKDTAAQAIPQFTQLTYEKSLEAHRNMIMASDFVVASDPGAAGVFDFVPDHQLAGDTLQFVREAPDFLPIATIPDGRGKGFHVFKKISSFSGWKNVSGFREFEGPYPERSLPVVCWATWPESSVALDHGTATRLALNISCRSEPGQQMTIRYHDQILTKVDFTDREKFVDLSMEFERVPGATTVSFEFAKPLSEENAAVLFRKLQFRDAARMQR
jgi:hypothetical protein